MIRLKIKYQVNFYCPTFYCNVISFTQAEIRGTSLRNGGSPGSGREPALTSASGVSSTTVAPQGPVMHFFTKLRRHTSLEGASPYLKIKRWKFDSSQRASSLETRGDICKAQLKLQNHCFGTYIFLTNPFLHNKYLLDLKELLSLGSLSIINTIYSLILFIFLIF